VTADYLLGHHRDQFIATQHVRHVERCVARLSTALHVAARIQHRAQHSDITARTRLVNRRPPASIREIWARSVRQQPLGTRHLSPADEIVEYRLAVGGTASEASAVPDSLERCRSGSAAFFCRISKAFLEAKPSSFHHRPRVPRRGWIGLNGFASAPHLAAAQSLGEFVRHDPVSRISICGVRQPVGPIDGWQAPGTDTHPRSSRL
jgi:hypothetical protein